MAPSDRLPAAIASRLVSVSLMLVGGYLAAITVMWATSHGGVDAGGRPLGSDFSSFWSAGRLALAGAPEAAYDYALHAAMQRSIFGDDTPFYPWPYPPMFFAVAALLATLPYLVALVVWQAATLPLYLGAVATIVGWRRRDAALAALAFPAVFVNLAHGHNGFLTAGLFGLGLVLLGRRPILAGVLLGLLCYKPQFALLLPFALAAGGYRRAFFAAAATVVLLAALSLAAFGTEAWTGFLGSATATRTVVLEAGGTGWEKIISAFAAARALGGDIAVGYAVQGVTTLAVIALTVRLWRSEAPFERKAAALLAGSLLVTPYALDYDMLLLGPAIAFLVRDAFARGWRPWAAAVLLGAYIAPIAARGIAAATYVPVGFLSTLAVFALAAFRGVTLPSLSRDPAHVQR